MKMEVSYLILAVCMLLTNARAQVDGNETPTDAERRAANRKIRIKLSGSMPVIEIERSENDRDSNYNEIIQNPRHNLKSRLSNLRTGSPEAPTTDATTPSFLFDQILNDAKLTPSPLANYRKGISNRIHDYRRAKSSSDSSSDDITGVSSEELYKWKEDWKKIWNLKKLEVLNATALPKGDFVNMVAARPWGVPCGDPKQNPAPWGSCTLPQECEPEFRIYRGDRACGKTEFICCGIQHTAYDFNNAFDPSFESTDMQSGTGETSSTSLDSKEKRKRDKRRHKKHRRKERKKRKKRIKRNIKRIVKQMRKILTKMQKRGDKNKKWKTKQLKKYVKYLKMQYKMDLSNMIDIHANQFIRVDKNMLLKMKKVGALNTKFQNNPDFMKILLKGEMSKQTARNLFESFPELLEDLEDTRRTSYQNPNANLFDYDIEYGFLYF